MNTEAIIGQAGTGKSFLLRQRLSDDPNYALLTASTGIAAVNLGEGVTTVHSALGFYDLRSLEEAHRFGRIRARAVALADKGRKNLVIDEISMVDGRYLEIIHEGFQQAAQTVMCDSDRQSRGIQPCGLIACGDFCQLPPVPDYPKQPVQFAFEAPCWSEFEKHLEHLTKVWRHEDPKFLEGLQLARAGRAVDAAFALLKCGVEFGNTEDDEFDGITLFPVNAQVDAFNARRLMELPGDVIELPSKRWGKEASEWKKIPDVLELKPDALVMVLVNNPPQFDYVNGDLATFLEVDDMGEVHVKTKRGYEGPIPQTLRRNLSFAPGDSLEEEYKSGPEYLGEIPEHKDCNCVFPPNPFSGQTFKCLDCERWYYYFERKDKWVCNDSPWSRWKAAYENYMERHTMQGVRYYDPKNQGTVVGEIQYMPLRLAYASSFHKVQGLTLDNVQVSMNHFCAGNPGMLYVALSRARSVEGLRIVGDLKSVARKIKTDARVRRWV